MDTKQWIVERIYCNLKQWRYDEAPPSMSVTSGRMKDLSNQSFATFRDVMEIISELLGVRLDSGAWASTDDGILCGSFMINMNGDEATDDELESWEHGDTELQIMHVTAYVHLKEVPTSTEIEQELFGI